MCGNRQTMKCSAKKKKKNSRTTTGCAVSVDTKKKPIGGRTDRIFRKTQHRAAITYLLLLWSHHNHSSCCLLWGIWKDINIENAECMALVLFLGGQNLQDPIGSRFQFVWQSPGQSSQRTKCRSGLLITKWIGYWFCRSGNNNRVRA